VQVQGSQNYEKFSMYKNDKTTHTRTRHGPPEMHILPRTQAQVRASACPPSPPTPQKPRASTGSLQLISADLRPQEYGFFTQQQQRFEPANGGPYYPRNASQETKIADALAKDFAKG
jgi:hypothetical protein